mgnify:CR=1 FL=1
MTKLKKQFVRIKSNDIEKVKQDLKNDINGAYDAIEALLERKVALEEKLKELNHSELIK